jgi:hypothetical protein
MNEGWMLPAISVAPSGAIYAFPEIKSRGGGQTR